MSNSNHLIAASLVLVLLVFVVGARLLYVRIAEMRERRIHPQAMATSAQTAAQLKNMQASDNFKNLFEVPVLFYALVAIALATSHTPAWLVAGAWAFVGLRCLHSLIQCTYNRVMHRFAVFVSSFVLLVGLWTAFVAALQA